MNKEKSVKTNKQLVWPIVYGRLRDLQVKVYFALVSQIYPL